MTELHSNDLNTFLNYTSTLGDLPWTNLLQNHVPLFCLGFRKTLAVQTSLDESLCTKAVYGMHHVFSFFATSNNRINNSKFIKALRERNARTGNAYDAPLHAAYGIKTQLPYWRQDRYFTQGLHSQIVQSPLWWNINHFSECRLMNKGIINS